MGGRASSARPHYVAIVALAALYLLIGLMVRNSYYQLIMTLVLLWATMGLAWNMLSGYSGLISFGHAAFFGLGGYTMTIAFVKFGITPWIGIPLGVVVGVLAGVVIGVPTFRLRGHYFALSMLAYPLAMLYVFEWLGYQEVTLPMMREQPALYAQFSDTRAYMAIALALLVACMIVSLKVERSRFGRSLLAIKQNEPAAEAAGIDVLRWKMLAMMLSAAMAAAAGGIYAVVLLVVTPPTMFGMLVSAQALIVALFGGVGVFWGPVIGAAVLVPLAETLHAELGHIVPGIQGVVYGVAIIVIILLAPEGIYWRIQDAFAARARTASRIGAARAPAPAAAPEVAEAIVARPQAPAVVRAFAEPLLRLDGVSRAFGGLRAVDDVTLTVPEGSIYGIIGPNGAGKTTLFNVVNGFLAPAVGSIRFAGQELVGLKPHQVCRLGVGRTFQIVRAFRRMTILENVITGAYAGAPDDAQAERLASAALERVGLAGEEAHAIADGLTTRQLRLMELARALAPRPRLLLLDETLAGLGRDELEAVLAIVRQLNREGVTIVIIEHTMHAMVKLADHFSVLDHGRLIAGGTPAEVVRNPAVIEAYLGKKWMDRAEGSLA
jgi:ABC-type branched-subunit amino acid transport system ATPase component/ABC-type branched-subunit amino acid transport system permease subunit